MASTHTSLDAAATERKARLAKLASLKRKQPHPSHPSDDETPASSTEQITGIPSPPPDSTTHHLSLRNYDPETRGPKLGFESAPVAPDQETLERRAVALAAETKAAEEKEEKERADGKGIDLFDLAPKKPNWDLKRDLALKLEVLGQRTDNAIARLVRERVEGQKKKETEERVGQVDGEGDGERVGIGGVDLVEGVHVREREEEEDERREKELDRDLEG